MPATHVLVTAIHRLPRRTNAPLAFIDLMDKTLAVSHSDYYVVPEREQAGGESRSLQGGAQIVNLRGFAGAIHAGKADEHSSSAGPVSHGHLPFSISVCLRPPVAGGTRRHG